MAEKRSDGIRDFVFLQFGGGELIEKGLKQMKIISVYHRDVHRFPRQKTRQFDPAEPAPHDDNMLAFFIGHKFSPHFLNKCFT